MSTLKRTSSQSLENKRAKLIKHSQTLYIKNLNDKINMGLVKENLYLLFSTYGDILDIVMMKNSKMRGQAHIIFNSVNNASLALKSLNNEVFFGKQLMIQFSHEKSKKLVEFGDL